MKPPVGTAAGWFGDDRRIHAFDVETLQPTPSRFERSDTCAVPAAGVVAEAVVAPVIAHALLEKLGGDHLDEILDRFVRYRKNITNTFRA